MAQKITTFLTFDNQAEEAMNFYVSLFKDSKVVNIMRIGGDQGFLTGTMELAGQKFMVLNGGPHFKFAQGISLFINCETQEEIDHFWYKLSEGGEQQRCGWVKDKYGVSWQVVPTVLGELMHQNEPEKSKRVMEAMLKMDKFEIAKLREAAK
jgi:predicted 3-demethylubiquinone-9 3-methyltransferase (glyoxalase superfamily)